jgi:hypothetical protein
MTGDPHQIRLFAARLRREAETVLALASRAGHTREVAWRAPAAQAFRARVGDLVMGLHRVADDLDTAAAALDGHALALDVARDALRHAAASAERAVHDALTGVSRVAG